MTAQHRISDERALTLAAKAVYSREARRKLFGIRTRLKSVDAKLSNALATGVLQRTAQLDKAQLGVSQHVARAEARLDALRKADVHGWPAHRERVEDAWEGLHRSIRRLIAHLAPDDESR